MKPGVKIWVRKLLDIKGVLGTFSGIGDRCFWSFLWDFKTRFLNFVLLYRSDSIPSLVSMYEIISYVCLSKQRNSLAGMQNE